MKIGIATFHWTDNYGAVLQAYALQSLLQQRGHDAQLVDYRPSPATFARKWLAKTPKRCVRKWEAALKRGKFERFRKKHLTRTPEIMYSARDIQKLTARFDCLITGSDQVWNPRWLDQVDGFWDLYFLSFAGTKTKRISYAASIGHADTSTLTEDWWHQLEDRMKQMDAISVREKTSVPLVEAICGCKDVVQVADPTLLLDRNHYENLAGSSSKRAPYLFSYMLHGLDRDFQRQTQEIINRLGLKMVRCNAKKTRLHPDYVLPSPTGWLREIRDASLVVTNSFHATVFCLIFHVPFVAVLIGGAISSMNSRIIDLLEMVGLSDRMASGGDPVPPSIFDKTIDWKSVDDQRANVQSISLVFLSKQSL